MRTQMIVSVVVVLLLVASLSATPLPEILFADDNITTAIVSTVVTIVLLYQKPREWIYRHCVALFGREKQDA